ncbi:hypothetical protein ACI4BF_28170, partial [Klebsiella pneumoniae]|uniref:hypothetical protein n=1 Tax=Klebsiella pneumoniae TaxID=573 RepID=UPI003852CB2F
SKMTSDLVRYQDTYQIPGEVNPWNYPGVPQAAMSPVDINGDGLVDVVVAFQQSGTGGMQPMSIQSVFLNTGRGFKAATNIALPANVYLA